MEAWTPAGWLRNLNMVAYRGLFHFGCGFFYIYGTYYDLQIVTAHSQSYGGRFKYLTFLNLVRIERGNGECSPALQSDLHVLSQFQILRPCVLLILNTKSVFPSYVDFGLLLNFTVAFLRLSYKLVYNKLKFIVTKPDCNSCKSCIQIIPGLNCV